MFMGRYLPILLFVFPLSAQTPLSQVRKVCVDKIVGPEPLASATRELAFTALYATKRFAVLEKCDKAEASLKGAILEVADRQSRAESESIGFGAVAGGANASGGGIAGVGGSNGETLTRSDVKRQATLALRLVDSDGAVLWAHSQDSAGGKTKAPMADAMERAVRQLVKDSVRTGSEAPAPLATELQGKP
ncbi:MAG: hypothetical protein J0L64_19840 [Acidobacteria bacterium]|nr:hypothetical protein [Acidobacteriota bacterium]